MPNPKTGTVTFDVAKAVRDAKAGKLEYRTDRGANVHLSIGRKSFDERQLLENYAAVVDEIVRARPAAAKGRYIRSITVTTSMGPGVKIVTSPRSSRRFPPRAGSRPDVLDRHARRQRQPAALRAEDRPRRRPASRPVRARPGSAEYGPAQAGPYS
jgi:hypothetical protein